MFASARKALSVIFDPAFRGVVLKAILLTIAVFAALFIGAEYAIQQLPTLKWEWVNTLLEWLTPVAVLVLLFVLGAPVAAIIATFYLDDIAEAVEARYYPADPQASGAPFFAALWAGLRLGATVVLVNLLLLPFVVFVPLFGQLAAILVNGWLLGREYFELAALRHMSWGAARSMRRRHGTRVFASGLLIALVSAIPIVNLFAPLFGSAFMVHQFKRFSHEG